MAVRQYIGARYVPRFTGLYDNTQSYEALDVVDNGSGTSYIAKKPTPAGTPLTDTNYWFLYGSTNGAIINLQDQINDMKDGTVSGSLQQQINTNKADMEKAPWTIDAMSKKTVILISDSWGVTQSGGVNNWIDVITPYFYKVYSSALGGISFNTSPDNFMTLLGAVSVDPDDVIDAIIVIGGANGCSNGDVTTFINYAKGLFPHAEIIIGGNGPEYAQSRHWQISKFIETECAKANVKCIKGLWENTLNIPLSNWTSDLYHLKDHNKFVANILGYLTSDCFAYEYPVQTNIHSNIDYTNGSIMSDYFKDISTSTYSRVENNVYFGARFTKGTNFNNAPASVTLADNTDYVIGDIQIPNLLTNYNNNYSGTNFHSYDVYQNDYFILYLQKNSGAGDPYWQLILHTKSGVSGSYNKTTLFPNPMIDLFYTSKLFDFKPLSATNMCYMVALNSNYSYDPS